MKHYSVLLEEAIKHLEIKANGIYVDATLGYAGHSKRILEKIPDGILYAFDKDQEAIESSSLELKKIGKNFKIFHKDFIYIKDCLKEEQVNLVDGILFDLGVSSPQIDNDKRGFSFMNDGFLDMRMDQREQKSAWQVVNEYSLENLLSIFYSYGEEPRSKQIASCIVEKRQKKSIDTTKELVAIILEGVGANYFYKKHPERNIFQAIRIEVNQELEDIEKVLPEAIHLLKKGGRMCVITFHSLEDRIVKKIFKKYSETNELVNGLPDIPEEFKPLIKIINKKPIVASEEELKMNSRSRSAKLRVIERI